MDANASKSLVPLPPEHGSLVPVSSVLVAEFASRPDLLALLWRYFCKLATLFFLVFAVSRRPRRELNEKRFPANQWRPHTPPAVLPDASMQATDHTPLTPTPQTTKHTTRH